VYLRFIYHFTAASGNIGLWYGCGQLSVVWCGVVGLGGGGMGMEGNEDIMELVFSLEIF
jgi:hypothetical protein